MTCISTGTFSATGVSDAVCVAGDFNVCLSFSEAAARVVLQRSFDEGQTWIDVSAGFDGEVVEFRSDYSGTLREIEAGVYYRFNCTQRVRGSILYRIGQ